MNYALGLVLAGLCAWMAFSMVDRSAAGITFNPKRNALVGFTSLFLNAAVKLFVAVIPVHSDASGIYLGYPKHRR